LELSKRSLAALRSAQNIYWRTAGAPPWRVKRPALDEVKLPTVHWVLTQALSLGFVLDRRVERNLWDAAVGHARSLLPKSRGAFSAEAIWAHGSLMELFLVAHGMSVDETHGFADLSDSADDESLHHLEQFIVLANQTSETFYVHSTKRQLERYTDWWLTPEFVEACEQSQEDPKAARMRELATALIARLVRK